MQVIMALIDEVKNVLAEVLQLGDIIDTFDADTLILGSIAEFDSMAIVSVITALEEYFGFEVDDDEIESETFESLGSLTDFVQRKLDDLA